MRRLQSLFPAVCAVLIFSVDRKINKFVSEHPEGDMDDEAIAALNTLLEKRFDPEDFEEVDFDSNAELVQFVREERRRELCYEGHRWFDLRRWGMPAITHTWHNDKSQSSTYTLLEGDLLYTIPIPDEALQSNASLVQNELPGKRTAQ